MIHARRRRMVVIVMVMMVATRHSQHRHTRQKQSGDLFLDRHPELPSLELHPEFHTYSELRCHANPKCRPPALSPTCVRPQAIWARGFSTTGRLLRLPGLRWRILPILILLILIPPIRWRSRSWLPVPIMSIIMMFHHHRRRRCRSLLASQAAHHHHTSRNHSSPRLRSRHRLSFRFSLQSLPPEMQLPTPQAPQTPQISQSFAHISYTLRKE
jgi:hypothetical protein